MTSTTGHIVPSHPGEILANIVIPGLNQTRAAFARSIGVSRPALYAVLNGKPLTREMAGRIAHVTRSDRGFWLRLQANYDAMVPTPELDAELEKLPVCHPARDPDPLSASKIDPAA